jgi:hypothetical protein
MRVIAVRAMPDGIDMQLGHHIPVIFIGGDLYPSHGGRIETGALSQ